MFSPNGYHSYTVLIHNYKLNYFTLSVGNLWYSVQQKSRYLSRCFGQNVLQLHDFLYQTVEIIAGWTS